MINLLLKDVTKAFFECSTQDILGFFGKYPYKNDMLRIDTLYI
jgi:hypothetical protein